MKILHVDDSKDDAEIVKYSLRRIDENLEVQWLENPAQLPKLIKEESYDCVLCDYQMPEMDGLELLQKLRDDDCEIPFVLLTGQGNENVASKALSQGADDYFTKDVGFAHFERLAHTIKRAVSTSRANTSVAEFSPAVFSLLEQLPESVCVVFQNRFLFANRPFLDNIGAKTNEEVLMRSVLQFIPAEDMDMFDELYESHRKVRQKQFSTSLRGLNGQVMPMTASIARMQHNNDKAMLVILRPAKF